MGVVLLAAPRPAVAAKSDVVVLRNGDRITCEVKILQRGKLQVKTDDMGTVDIEWDKIREITANGLFEVEDTRGRLFFGSLRPGPGDSELDIVGLARTTTLGLPAVVRVQEIKTSFWKRLSGSLDAGFSYTSSSRLAQFNLDSRLTFRRPTFQLELRASSIVTRQPDAPQTQRGSADFGYVRFRENRQTVFGLVSLEQNRELGYDLRAGLRGGWGRYLVRSQGNELLAGIGLNANREVPVEGDPTENLEALIVLNWANFAYSTPKTDVEIGLLVFPSLTSWGRWRFELDARIKRELFKDFFVSAKGYDSFDSDPATAGASRNDWGVTFGLGYSFS
jgi:hypothetical protein